MWGKSLETMQTALKLVMEMETAKTVHVLIQRVVLRGNVGLSVTIILIAPITSQETLATIMENVRVIVPVNIALAP